MSSHSRRIEFDAPLGWVQVEYEFYPSIGKAFVEKACIEDVSTGRLVPIPLPPALCQRIEASEQGDLVEWAREDEAERDDNERRAA